MRPVNLLPSDISRRSTRRRSTRFGRVTGRGPTASPLVLVALGALVLLSALLALAFVRESGKVDEKRQTLESLQQQLAAIPAPRPQNAGADNAAAQRIAAFAAATQQRIAFDRVLADVSRVIPEDAWLTTLRAQSPLTAAAAAPTTTATTVPTSFTATGYAPSQKGVARVISRLELVPGLTNVQLQSSAFTVLSERRVVQFTLLADVQPIASS